VGVLAVHGVLVYRARNVERRVDAHGRAGGPPPQEPEVPGELGENGHELSLVEQTPEGMRIKVIEGKIAEVETVIRRKEGRPPFGDAAGFVHDKRFAEAPRAKERPSRAVIAAAVQSYYKSVERNNGTVFAKFDPACERVENGVLADTGRNAMAQGCAAQLKAGLFADVGGVRFRVPVIDAERGVAVAFGYFDYPQRETSFKTSDGRSFEAETKYPYSLNFATLFKVTRSGAIQRVDQVAPELNYRIPSPWKE